MKIETLALKELTPYANNSRTHSAEQVDQIVASISEFGFTNPVLISDDGEIIAGHGRVLAAKKLKLKTVPCIRLGHLTEDQRRAYVIADNKLALNAGWDEETLRKEMQALSENGFDLATTGFSDDELMELMGADEDGQAGGYTRKIEAPVYTPKGEQPSIAQMLNRDRTDKLLADIVAADIPDDVRGFLQAAAMRHLVFDYSQVAEYYSHAPAEIQRLMEASALVIIDYQQAVEHGYVRLTARLQHAFANDHQVEAL